MATRTSTTRRKTTGRKKSTATRKKSTATRKKSTVTRKKTTTARKKTTSRKTSGRKKTSSRKYSPAAGESVRKEMEEFKRGTARSGRKGGKVKSRKQAIAIGLSEARRAGKKVPPNPKPRSRKKSG